jgi:signal transduction histidine kinase
MTTASDPLRMRRLLDAGRALVGELDPRAVLDRILSAAREVTGARCGALTVFDHQGDGLELFLTLGVDEPARSTIGVEPLRLVDVTRRERFFGVPIVVGGKPRGSLYVTDKQDGPFTAADEEAVVILADWAGGAIGEARHHGSGERRPTRHEQAEGATDTGLERVLELIVRRGRTLIDTSGRGPADALTRDDEQRLRSFAASAATAVALAQSVESDRLRGLLAVADAERSRWARELHDETMQGLGALHLLLAAARRRGDARETELALDEAIEHLGQEIRNLHAIISELRPAALDELGLGPALDVLLESRTSLGAFAITSEIDVPGLAPDLESTIYRLVQEALTNVVRHADAHNVHVAVIATADGVSIEIRDDGGGFDPDTAPVGFGLISMRERVAQWRGTLTVLSGDLGTVVRAHLPADGGADGLRRSS